MKNNYIVAAYWNDKDNHLGAYTYGSAVQYGDEENAEHFLDYVKRQSPDREWQIFWINTDRDVI